MTLPSDVNEGINQALSSGADAIKAPVETAGDEGVGGTTGRTVEGKIEERQCAKDRMFALAPSCGAPLADVALIGAQNPRRNDNQADSERRNSPADSQISHPAIPLESLARYSDEGENGWNAWGRADIARKMNRIAAGGYNSVEKLISKVEELAEVGQ